MAWKEVGNMDNWKYKEIGDQIEGQYKGFEPHVGQHDSNVYHLELDNGEVKGVWGSAIIDSRFSQIALGSKVKVIYDGVGEKKAGKNAMTLFKVFVDSTFRGQQVDDDGHPISSQDEHGNPITDEEIHS